MCERARTRAASERPSLACIIESAAFAPPQLGVILPDDNDPVFTWYNPGFPRIYWNAAASMYMYMVMPN